MRQTTRLPRPLGRSPPDTGPRRKRPGRFRPPFFRGARRAARGLPPLSATIHRTYGRMTSQPLDSDAPNSGDPGCRPSRRNTVNLGRDRDPLLASGLPTQYVDIDPDETQEWLESLDDVVDERRPLPGPLPHAVAAASGRASSNVGVPSLRSTDYINTIPPEREPWFPGDEEVERRIRALHPLERRDHGAPRAAPGHRRRRPHLHLRVVGDAVRGRLQPLLPRQGPPRRRRPGLLPGPRLPRHLRPRLPRGPAHRATSSTASARSCRTRAAACRPTRTRG